MNKIDSALFLLEEHEEEGKDGNFEQFDKAMGKSAKYYEPYLKGKPKDLDTMLGEIKSRYLLKTDVNTLGDLGELAKR